MRRAHQEDFADRVVVRWADVDMRAGRISNRKDRLETYRETREGESTAQFECGRDVVPREDPTLFEREEDGEVSTYWTGIKACGSVWCCGVCGPKILHAKGEELQELITAHRRNGGEVYLLTATIPHRRGHTTHEVAEAVLESWRYLWRGSPADRWADRIGLVGKIRAIDGTFGPNGPHPHVHGLLFTEGALEEELEARFLNWAKSRWERKVHSWRELETSRGRVIDAFPLNRRLPEDHEAYFGRPHRVKGLQLQQAEYAGAYVSELGLGREATRMDVKRGRTGEHMTPRQVLAAYVLAKREGDEDAMKRLGARWISWCQAMHGKRHLTGVRRVAERLEPHIDRQLEITDEEEAVREEREEGDRKRMQLSSGLWWHLRWQVPHGLAEELEALADRHDLDTIRAILQGVVGDGRSVGLEPERRRLYSAPP